MRLHPASSEPPPCPKALAFVLPHHLVERAVDGLSWLSLFASVMSVGVIAIHAALQPEVAAVWAHPVLRLVMLGMVFSSVGFAAVQRGGLLSKPTLLNAGVAFQVVIAFGCSMLESSVHQDPHSVVLGISGVAVWMMLCGRLMANAPLKSALTGALCAASWPLAYWLNLQMLGFEAMPLRRLAVRVLPLIIVAGWMYALNNRILKFYVRQQRAEDVGSYVLTKLIGSGGMGEVWQAKHTTLARDAAVKLIRRELLTTSTGRQEQILKRRFEREAQVTASLRSAHTVAMYDYGQTRDGSFFYAMELLQGIDLQSMVERFGPLEPCRAAYLMQQVAQSLEEAHMAGLVHRDIKPRNIMVNKLGVEYDIAKVLDFGLVKSLGVGELSALQLSADNVTTGTPAYLSPESASGESAIDARSDLYSLGCTAYYLLTGHMVFEATTPTAYALAHIQQEPVPLSERSEQPIPPAFEELVMQMLAKRPERRIQGARELGRRLRALPCINEWSPERAEQWWEANLPEVAFRPPPAEELTLTAAERSTV